MAVPSTRVRQQQLEQQAQAFDKENATATHAAVTMVKVEAAITAPPEAVLAPLASTRGGCVWATAAQKWMRRAPRVRVR